MLREQISDALKSAMKAGDTRSRSTLRLIMAALKDRDIAARGEGNGEPVPDTEIVSMLQTMVRQRRDAIELYERGGRLELAQQEAEEIQVIERFLPQQMSGDEVEQAGRAAIEELGAAGLKDMGRVMGELKRRYPGQMDMGRASGVVKSLLG